MKVPILLIAFNRLEKTKQVFSKIKLYEPQQLFLAADGPRKNIQGDNEKCSEVRSWLLNNIDWECEVKTLFQNDNIGCGLGPADAITWFFNYVDEGIILEDDTVPHIEFFDYSSILLAKYRNNLEVMAINSSNFQDRKHGDGSYYFSMQNGPFCAWATWKRSWSFFDYSLDKYSEIQLKKAFVNYRTTRREKKWWLGIYKGVINDVYSGSSWDYQHIFAMWINQGKSIVPNTNLSTNIGFGPDATHTTNPESATANKPVYPILPLVHPSNEKVCRKADLYYHDLYYDKFVEHVTFVKKIKRLIKKQIKSLKK